VCVVESAELWSCGVGVQYYVVYQRSTSRSKMPAIPLLSLAVVENLQKSAIPLLSLAVVESRLVVSQPDDATFLVRSPPGTLFSPSKVHRSDGLSLFASGECLSIGSKLYSKPVPSRDALSQYRSTDPSAAYELAGEERLNQGAILFVLNGKSIV
jgi:hypothetical protein